MAQLAGMELERRVADWDGSPFTADSERHVSVWRTPVRRPATLGHLPRSRLRA
jgi:hypothetical protein